jgi:hypothetical protein
VQQLLVLKEAGYTLLGRCLCWQRLLTISNMFAFTLNPTRSGELPTQLISVLLSVGSHKAFDSEITGKCQCQACTIFSASALNAQMIHGAVYNPCERRVGTNMQSTVSHVPRTLKMLTQWPTLY